MKGFLDNLSTQTHKDLEIVLDHNEPTDEEINLVEEYNNCLLYTSPSPRDS